MLHIIKDYINFEESAPLKMSYEWKTDIVSYDSGLEQRNFVMSRPRRHWSMNLSIMDKTARDSLIRLFNKARGRYETFLYKDVDSYLCDYDECSGLAIDSTHFQLKKRYYHGETEYWDENKTAIVAGSIFQPAVKINGGTALVEGAGAGKFTLDDTTGIVTFGTALSNPATDVITATFQYYYKVRFNMDVLEDIMFETGVYENQSVELVEVISA